MKKDSGLPFALGAAGLLAAAGLLRQRGSLKLKASPKLEGSRSRSESDLPPGMNRNFDIWSENDLSLKRVFQAREEPMTQWAPPASHSFEVSLGRFSTELELAAAIGLKPGAKVLLEENCQGVTVNIPSDGSSKDGLKLFVEWHGQPSLKILADKLLIWGDEYRDLFKSDRQVTKEVCEEARDIIAALGGLASVSEVYPASPEGVKACRARHASHWSAMRLAESPRTARVYQEWTIVKHNFNVQHHRDLSGRDTLSYDSHEDPGSPDRITEDPMAFWGFLESSMGRNPSVAHLGQQYRISDTYQDGSGDLRVRWALPAPVQVFRKMAGERFVADGGNTQRQAGWSYILRKIDGLLDDVRN